MNLFNDWYRRHLAAHDPTPEPASPPPWAMGDRVVVSAPAMDGMFTNGRHGEVIGVEFTADTGDVYGPWITTVLLDGDSKGMAFHAAELTREPVADVEKEDLSADEPVPYAPVGEVLPDSLAPWIQRAKELRHETVDVNTSVYDDVVQSAMSRDGLAAEVEQYLAEVAS